MTYLKKNNFSVIFSGILLNLCIFCIKVYKTKIFLTCNHYSKKKKRCCRVKNFCCYCSSSSCDHLLYTERKASKSRTNHSSSLPPPLLGGNVGNVRWWPNKHMISCYDIGSLAFGTIDINSNTNHIFCDKCLFSNIVRYLFNPYYHNYYIFFVVWVLN